MDYRRKTRFNPAEYIRTGIISAEVWANTRDQDGRVKHADNG